MARNVDLSRNNKLHIVTFYCIFINDPEASISHFLRSGNALLDINHKY